MKEFKQFIIRAGKFAIVSLVVTLLTMWWSPSTWTTDNCILFGAILSGVIGIVTVFYDKKCLEEQGYTGTTGASLLGAWVMSIIILLVSWLF